MYRRVTLLLLLTACAETTGPELRSVQAPEHAGRPVYSDYELTLYLTDGSVYDTDTIHVESDGRVSRWTGDLHTVLHPGHIYEPTWPYLPALPLMRGEVVETRFRQLTETTWLSGPSLGQPCTHGEESFRTAVEPWRGPGQCRELLDVRSIWLAGSVRPNRVATGQFFAIEESPFREPHGTFMLAPIRGRPLTWPVEPVVTYSVVPVDTALVYPQESGFRFTPIGYVLVKGSDGYHVGRTTIEHLAYTVPAGCVQVEEWIECSAEVSLPFTFVVTVRPGVEWYTFGLAPLSNYVVVPDFSGQEITVLIKSELTD